LQPPTIKNKDKCILKNPKLDMKLIILLFYKPEEWRRT
jgi:hypothetical protein